MKKLILIAVLIMTLGSLDAQDLFLKPLSASTSGKDTVRYYYLVKRGETTRQDVKDSVSGRFLISRYTTMEADTILDTILVIGDAIRTDYIVCAYEDSAFYAADQIQVKELGFSKWGFKKKMRLTTTHDAYYRLSQEPATIVMRTETKIEEKGHFAFLSIVKLVLIFFLGLIVAELIFRPKKFLKELIDNSNVVAFFIFLLILILSLIAVFKALSMGTIFIVISVICLLLPTLLQIIWPEKEKAIIIKDEI